MFLFSSSEQSKLIDEAIKASNLFAQGIYTAKIEFEPKDRKLKELRDALNLAFDNVNKTVSSVIQTFDKYSHYDYTAKMPTASLQSQGLALAESVNQLGQELSSIFRINLANGLVLEDASDALDKHINSLSVSNSEQAVSLKDSNESIDQISKAITYNFSQIEQISNITVEMKSEAENGFTLLDNSKSAMDEIVKATKTIDSAVELIKDISEQTNVLSINAAIEAATAGEAGKGFAIVAQEVRKLANKSSDAAKQIKMLAWDAAQKAYYGQEISAQIAHGFESVRDKIDHTTDLINHVVGVGREQLKGVESLNNTSERLDSAMQRNTQISNETFVISNKVAKMAHELLTEANNINFAGKNAVKEQRSMDNFYETTEGDILIANKAIECANAISKLFEDALNTNKIKYEDLFSDIHDPIAGTNPLQYKTPYLYLTDMLLPAIQEPVLAFDKRIVFCAAMDRFAFLPTHNNAISKPQKEPNTSENIAWNTANSRNRRFFKDKTGTSLALNTQEFLIQTYWRDMGNNNFILMKDASAPIFVKGKHWGGFRIGYKPL